MILAVAWVLPLLAAGAEAGAEAETEPVRVAVAANFAAPAQALAAAFERERGYAVQLAFGATGNFYAQIRHGAPFAVLLAADEGTPARLLAEGLAVAGSRHTYAIGKLVLWSAQAGVVDDAGAVLRRGAFDKLAVADARTAPYGLAAEQALTALGLLEALRGRLVHGESVGQAFQFVASGNVALGFVALSQLRGEGAAGGGSMWLVPQALYAPIRQDAVLLAGYEDSVVARAWLAWLQSEPARSMIRAYGYDLP